MYECATCIEDFYWKDDCDEHMTYYGHWIECETCTREFRTQSACDQHMNSLDHWAPQYECETCDRKFSTERAVNQHMDAMDHRAPQYECETCNRKFHTETAVDQHMNSAGHWANYCKLCDRHFKNPNNLRMHMTSKIHRGQDISCPFCQKGYVTATGVAHHLERGACPNAPQLNRETIHRMIRKLDPHGTITNKQLEWHPEDAAVYEATNQAYNGHAWECYLCHREFNKWRSLNQHLNSPAHQQNIYHCLNRRTPCRKDFTSLAALFNHLESESCGAMRFENVQDVQRQVTDAIRGGRMLTGF